MHYFRCLVLPFLAASLRIGDDDFDNIHDGAAQVQSSGLAAEDTIGSVRQPASRVKQAIEALAAQRAQVLAKGAAHHILSVRRPTGARERQAARGPVRKPGARVKQAMQDTSAPVRPPMSLAEQAHRLSAIVAPLVGKSQEISFGIGLVLMLGLAGSASCCFVALQGPEEIVANDRGEVQDESQDTDVTQEPSYEVLDSIGHGSCVTGQTSAVFRDEESCIPTVSQIVSAGGNLRERKEMVKGASAELQDKFQQTHAKRVTRAQAEDGTRCVRATSSREDVLAKLEQAKSRRGSVESAAGAEERPEESPKEAA